MSRKLIILCVIAGLAVTGVVIWSLIPPEPGVSPTNYRRLEHGMNESEVEAILGEKGTDWEENRKVWHDTDVIIWVRFNKQGKAVEKALGTPDTFVTKLRRRVGL